MKYYVILTLFAISCSSKPEVIEEDTVYPDRVIATIDDHPLEYDAGSDISLYARIRQDITQDSFLVFMTYSLGEHMMQVSPDQNRLLIPIPKEISNLRGAVYASIYRSGRLLARTHFKINPLEPYEQIASYSGPATIESSGIDWHLITAIPKDKYNNPVANGTIVNFASTYPNGAKRSLSKPIESLLTGIRIDPIKKAGKVYTGISSGSAHSTEREVLVTATWPVGFSLMVEEYYPVAEQRQVVRLNTSIIRDQYANTVADGTSVTFVRTDQSGEINTFNSFTVNGRAEVQLENPLDKSTWEVYAYVDQSARSKSIRLVFNESIKKIPIEYDTLQESIVFGPITGPLQQFVPNGTELLYSITGEAYANSYVAEIIDGYVDWTVPRKTYPPGEYIVKASLGSTQHTEKLIVSYRAEDINKTKSVLIDLGWPKGSYLSVSKYVDLKGRDELLEQLEGVHPLIRTVKVSEGPDEYDLIIGPVEPTKVSSIEDQLRVFKLLPNRIQIN